MSDALTDDLRKHFRTTCGVRLDEMQSQLSALRANRRNFDALQGLALHFHALAGLGSTYGYPRITEFGDSGEKTIFAMAQQHIEPSDEILSEWTELMQRTREELSRGE